MSVKLKMRSRKIDVDEMQRDGMAGLLRNVRLLSLLDQLEEFLPPVTPEVVEALPPSVRKLLPKAKAERKPKRNSGA